MAGKYIDYSSTAPAQYQEDYSKTYNQFYNSGGSGYYTLRIGIGLSSMLTGLDSALSLAGVDPDIRSNINLVNSGVVLACGFIVLVSNTFSAAKLKELVAMETPYLSYFNRLPSITMWGNNIPSARDNMTPLQSIEIAADVPAASSDLKTPLNPRR